MPTNRDGEAFVDPRNPDVQIRGWASQLRLPLDTEGLTSPSARPPASGVNFTTAQGLAALLQVDVGEEVSLMRLTLTLNGVEYNWEGQSPSDQFSEYYPLFNYIASQFQVQN